MKPHDFQDIYNSWYKKSYVFVKAYVQDEMVAEDIVSESLVKLWKTLTEKHIEYPQAFLLTLLRNRALDHLRREAMRSTIEEELVNTYQRELSIRISTLEACNPENIFSVEVNEIIEKTLATLPEQTRTIFKMSRFDGLSVKEIASNQSLSAKSVEYHITRSLKALRLSLKDYLTLLLFLFG